MKLKEFMRAPVISVSSHSSVAEAAKRMDQAGCGFLPVMEAGKVVGTITGRDIAVRSLGRDTEATSLPVTAIMTHPAVAISQNASCEEAMMLMKEACVRRLVVTGDGERVVGVIGLAELAGRVPTSMLTRTIQRHAENRPTAPHPISFLTAGAVISA